MKRLLASFFSMAILLCSTVQSYGHPHAWIDLSSALIFDEDGKVKGLHVGWLFDDFYSAFILESMTPHDDGSYDQAALDLLAKENLHNLDEYAYFTSVLQDGQQTAFRTVERYETYLKGKRLWMDFDILFETPLDPAKGVIEYAVYDPSYYIEILHAEEGDPIRFIGQGSMGCHYTLAKPSPSMELTLQMAGLDKTQTPATSMGQYFAERVIVQCP